MSVSTITTKPASEKQVKFAKSLLEQRAHNFDPEYIESVLTKGSTKSASMLIDALLKMPKVVKPAKDEPADGIYKVPANGTVHIYKVYKMVHGSGRQGVKSMSVKYHDDGTKEGVFTYIGLAVKYLPEGAEKMGKEEAIAYGKMYGFCVRCGATLTDEKSIARGMGKWCSDQQW